MGSEFAQDKSQSPAAYRSEAIADTVIEGGGRFLSVFSNGNTVDLAYFDDIAGTLKVRTIPVKV